MDIAEFLKCKFASVPSHLTFNQLCKLFEETVDGGPRKSDANCFLLPNFLCQALQWKVVRGPVKGSLRSRYSWPLVGRH